MDRLPPEIQQEIISYLWLDEMAHCRLVSHSFKVRVEESMKHITHLDLEISQSELEFPWFRSGYKEEMNESYVKHTFFSEPSVKAQAPSTLNSPVGSRFFAFLAKFCPNLQVLQMDLFKLSCDDLLLLGPNLQYFTCWNFHPGISGRTAASVHSRPEQWREQYRVAYGRDPGRTITANNVQLTIRPLHTASTSQSRGSITQEITVVDDGNDDDEIQIVSQPSSQGRAPLRPRNLVETFSQVRQSRHRR